VVPFFIVAYFDGVVDDDDEVAPVPLVPLAPLEPDGVELELADDGDEPEAELEVSLPAVPLTLPEAERLVPVVLLAVVLGVLVEAVVSVLLLLLDDGVLAVVVPGVVVDEVVVLFLSQPVAAAVARARTAIMGTSFFMGSPVQSFTGGSIADNARTTRATRDPLCSESVARAEKFPDGRKITRRPASVGTRLRVRVQCRKPGSMRSSLRRSAGHSITP
jgi:hypothetical protein